MNILNPNNHPNFLEKLLKDGDIQSDKITGMLLHYLLVNSTNRNLYWDSSSITDNSDADSDSLTELFLVLTHMNRLISNNNMCYTKNEFQNSNKNFESVRSFKFNYSILQNEIKTYCNVIEYNISEIYLKVFLHFKKN